MRVKSVNEHIVFRTCVAQILAVILIVLGFLAIIVNVLGIIYNGAFISSRPCVCFTFTLKFQARINKRRMWKVNLFPTETVYKVFNKL